MSCPRLSTLPATFARKLLSIEGCPKRRASVEMWRSLARWLPRASLIGIMIWGGAGQIRADDAPGAKNLIEDPGLETWNQERNLPAGPEWRWAVNPKTQFAVNERTNREHHGGEWSWHFVDSSTQAANDGVYWQLSGTEARKYAGRTLRAAAWIKQVKASAPKLVNVGLWVERQGGATLTKSAGPDSAGAVDWDAYSATVRIPADVRLIRLCLNCAHGWGQTGEAYFDDLELAVTADEPDAAEAAGPDAFFVSDAQGSRQYLFRDSLPPNWDKKSWGGLRIEAAETSARTGSAGLRVRCAQAAPAWAGVTLYTAALNRALDASAFGQAGGSLSFWLRGFADLQINLSCQGAENPKLRLAADLVKETKGEWRRYEIQLADLAKNGSLAAINGLTLQACATFKPEDKLELDEIALTAPGALARPGFAPLPPEKAAALAAACGPADQTFGQDARPRPEIRGGTFYLDGQPQFFVGPWVGDGSLFTDFGPGTERESLADPIHNRPFDPETAAVLGLNSLQLSAAASVGARLRHDAPLTERDVVQSERHAAWLKKLDGMPMILDFAWVSSLASPLLKEGRLPAEAAQQNSDWHEFIPLCPEHPAGRELYADYFRNGTRFCLNNGGNPFIYELFNESSYHCRCRFNREMFQARMAKQYGQIAKANETWGAQFKSFAEAAAVPFPEKFPGLWVDWCKFMGDRYAEILREGQSVIRAVDQRPNIYFTEQIALTNLWKSRGAGMDYRKIADALDVLTTEGGWSFGRQLDLGVDKGNAMEAALATHGLMYTFALEAFRALGRDRKPVVNNEHYCGRMLFGERAPSRKTDLLTAMWAEVFHGASGSFVYAWDKRVWEWHNFSEARAMVINGGYKAHCLQNPYSYPRESLDGFKQFSDELAQVRELALPAPRFKAGTVGLVYSYSTLRMSALTQLDLEARLSAAYGSLLYAQYPADVIFEEDLPAADLAGYELLVLPVSENSYAPTLPAVERYVRGGGRVFLVGGALAQTEYGRPLDASGFLGVRRSPIEPTEVKAAPAGAETAFSARRLFTVEPAGAETVLSDQAGAPLMTAYRLDAGTVYYLAADGTDAIASSLRLALEKEKVRRYGRIEALTGPALLNAEMQLIDRGGEKLAFLANWEDRGSRLVRVRLFAAQGGRLCDPFAGETYLNPAGGEEWTSEQLEAGVTLVLEPQTRKILRLTQGAAAGAKLTEAQIRAAFAEIQVREAPELKAVEDQARSLLERRRVARFQPDVHSDRCAGLDLSAQVNMAFRDEVDGDRQGGWFDQGVNDFRDLPLGKQVLAGVPFWILDPAKNQDKSALILYGPARPYFPIKAEGIAVNQPVAKLYFLHTVGWGVGPGELCFSYLVHYADGQTAEIPVRYGVNVSGWWNPLAVPEAKIACESGNQVCGRIGLYCQAWTNPRPDQPVATLDIIASKNNVVPAVVAITAEKP